jgi:tetratricopeptide (TPR) repeat protein
VAATVAAGIRADPEAWFAAEEAVLDGVVRQLVEEGLVEAAWELASHFRTVALLQGRLEVWRSTHLVSLEACRRVGDARGTASMLFGLGKLRHDEHDLRQPEPTELTAAAEGFRQLGETAAESRALGEIASWYGWTDKPERAEHPARTSLELARRSDNLEVLVDALFVLGRLRVRDERWSEARELLEEANVLCRRLAKPRSAAQVQWQLGAVRQAQGDLEGAIDMLAEAIEGIRSVRDRRGEARIVIELGAVYAKAGKIESAQQQLRLALEISREARAVNLRALALMVLSSTYEQRHELARARDSVTEALELWRQLGDASRRQQAELTLARLSADTGERRDPGRYPEDVEDDVAEHPA